MQKVLISITPAAVVRRLLKLVCFLIAANLAAVYAVEHFPAGSALHYLGYLFDLSEENNVPSFYSALALLLSAALLGLAGSVHQRRGEPFTGWFGLMLVFMFLSFDEIASLHEKLTEPTRALLGTSGVFYYAWVIPYGILLTLLVLAYSRFLLRLSRRFRFLFVASGSLFVLGAVGFEMLGSLAEQRGASVWVYAALTTVEESCEMLGIVLFIHTLLHYLSSVLGGLVIELKSSS